jgi:hypothetical protein
LSSGSGLANDSGAEGVVSSESTGELVSRFSRDISTLVRNELQLAQLELSQKAKKAGLGAGLFGAAGLLALYGVGVLIATAIPHSPWSYLRGWRPSSLG